MNWIEEKFEDLDYEESKKQKHIRWDSFRTGATAILEWAEGHCVQLHEGEVIDMRLLRALFKEEI